MEQFAQGDLLIEEINEERFNFLAKEETTEVEDGIVAHGESGHFHRIKDTDAVKILALVSGLMIVKVLRDTALIHEEHGPIPMKANKVYEIIRQREIDLNGEIVQVKD